MDWIFSTCELDTSSKKITLLNSSHLFMDFENILLHFSNKHILTRLYTLLRRNIVVVNSARLNGTRG